MNDPKRDASGYIYKINESEIFVRNRPNKLSMNFDKLDEDDKADVYISVTDTWMEPPLDRPLVWYPWNEDRKPTPELFYAINRVLRWHVYYRKTPKISINCDGGTHRSVTVFGAFLLTYHADIAEQVIKDRININKSDELDWANPLEYIEGYLKERPEDRLLLSAMGEDSMSRLDAHCRSIFDKVKERFGEER